MKENNNTSIVAKSELPILSDLYDINNIDLYFKKDQFNLLMNQPPETKWILKNPYANNSEYIPIGIVETLVQRIFKQHKIEILREGTMFNAVYMTVRVHYLHPSGEWLFHDGTGAVQVQTKKDSSPANLVDINNNAVMMALPAAKSFAIKDACEHIGKLFGRDLNRKETMGFGVDKNLDINSVYKEIVALSKEKKDLIPEHEMENLQRIIDNKEVLSYNKALKTLRTL